MRVNHVKLRQATLLKDQNWDFFGFFLTSLCFTERDLRSSFGDGAVIVFIQALLWGQFAAVSSQRLVFARNSEIGQNAENHKMNDSAHGRQALVTSQRSSDADLDPAGNLTAALQLPTFTTAAKVRVFITFILCGLSTLCNLAVLWAAHLQKRRSHVRVLIINLTLADLLVTFIVMPVDAVWNITVQWVAGDLACRLLMFLKLQAMYSCAFVTVVISLDRQFAILNPLAVITARTRNKAMLAAAWSASTVLSLPQVPAGGDCCSAHRHQPIPQRSRYLSSEVISPRKLRCLRMLVAQLGMSSNQRAVVWRLKNYNRISSALVSFVCRLFPAGGGGELKHPLFKTHTVPLHTRLYRPTQGPPSFISSLSTHH